jgi:hypothetical protein
MNNQKRFRRIGAGLLCIPLALGVVTVAGAQEDPAQQKVAAIKQSLQKSMAALHSYKWIETVTVKIDGEEKSKKQNQCYYGADGKQEKVPIDDPSATKKKKPRGLRGRIAKHKTEEMEDYVHAALALIKEYVPPDPAHLQAVKEKGAQQTKVLDNASRLRAEFPGYLKQGDVLSVDVDPKADRILGVGVSSYLEDDPKDAVTLNVTFSTFQDGTSYPAKIVLDGQSKKLEIVIENHGYEKL